jgi:hypothetical protein
MLPKFPEFNLTYIYLAPTVIFKWRYLSLGGISATEFFHLPNGHHIKHSVYFVKGKSELTNPLCICVIYAGSPILGATSPTLPNYKTREIFRAVITTNFCLSSTFINTGFLNVTHKCRGNFLDGMKSQKRQNFLIKQERYFTRDTHYPLDL